MAIQFLKGTSTSYNDPDFTPEDDVFYYTTDDLQLFLGKIKLSNSNEIAETIASIAQNAAEIDEIQDELKLLKSREAMNAGGSIVSSSKVVSVSYYEGRLYDGVTDVTVNIVGKEIPVDEDAGKYIRIEIRGVNEPLYISIRDIIDPVTLVGNQLDWGTF